jgi:hypothetical protein
LINSGEIPAYNKIIKIHMITRSQIRRQLRSQGGIMNVVGRQKYGLGSFVKKAFGKAKDVVSSVVKSPIGKAALLGTAAYFGGPAIMKGLGSIGPKFAAGKNFLTSSLFGNIASAGGTDVLTTPGILGKLGLTKGGGAMGLTGLGKVVGAGGLISYFTGKGKTEEEARELAQDVYRGEGLGLDLIKADIQKYRSGESSEADMFAKGYNFLVPRSRIRSKDGGIMRVKLEEGTPSPKAGSIKRMTNEEKAMQKQAEEAMMEGVMYTDPEGKRISSKEFQEAMRKITEAENMIMPKQKPKKAMGGMMSMPMGDMRKNKAGVMERDYRDKGGFVPVGIKEKADDVPAMLSKNEFVMTADAVRGAGNGSIEKGAQRMYDQMKQLEGKMA